jgi:hypothetical protein
VELAQVESGAERLFRPLALREDVLHADHERRRLARHRKVAVHRAFVGRMRARRILVEIRDGLFASPALVVQTAVDDQPRGAP